MKYYTKVDFFYWLVVLSITFLALFVSNFLFIMGLWYLSLVVVLAIGYILFALSFSHVQIVDDDIVIHVGFFEQKININSLVEVRRAGNIRTSPAMSINRVGLKIKNKKGKDKVVYISPKNEKEFLEELKTKSTNLPIVGF